MTSNNIESKDQPNSCNIPSKASRCPTLVLLRSGVLLAHALKRVPERLRFLHFHVFLHRLFLQRVVLVEHVAEGGCIAAIVVLWDWGCNRRDSNGQEGEDGNGEGLNKKMGDVRLCDFMIGQLGGKECCSYQEVSVETRAGSTYLHFREYTIRTASEMDLCRRDSKFKANKD